MFCILCVLATATHALPQQTSLYNSKGEAVAYIDYDQDATIFLWDGTPVAFLEKTGADTCLIGFNGEFLGWYADGVIRDRQGLIVGARKVALNMRYRMERVKGMQQIPSIRPLAPIIPVKPIWRDSWSDTCLVEFLNSGKK